MTPLEGIPRPVLAGLPRREGMKREDRATLWKPDDVPNDTSKSDSQAQLSSHKVDKRSNDSEW